MGIIVVKVTEGEVKSSNRTIGGASNKPKLLPICREVMRGHRELREATDAFDGRNNGVVSPGGDGIPDAPSSRSNEEFEATSFTGDG